MTPAFPEPARKLATVAPAGSGFGSAPTEGLPAMYSS